MKEGEEETKGCYEQWKRCDKEMKGREGKEK
jgi:hypothetical protein